MSLYLAGGGEDIIKYKVIEGSAVTSSLTAVHSGNFLQISRERKVGDRKSSRLLVDDNEWANCRPCNDYNKVTTTERE